MDKTGIQIDAEPPGAQGLAIACERGTAHMRTDNCWCGQCETLGQNKHFRPLHGNASTVALTPREFEVLALVVTGRDNKRIARVLAVSQHTVASHLKAIFAKTGTTNRTEAAVLAIRERLCN